MREKSVATRRKAKGEEHSEETREDSFSDSWTAPPAGPVGGKAIENKLLQNFER